MYNLRKVNKSDFETVYEIKKNALGKYIEETWGWDEEQQRKFHEDEINTEPIQIIETDNKPLGTICIIKEKDAVRITRLYIIDTYQSKGIGTEIIKQIISENSGNYIRLGVLKVNNRARILYEKLGFKICSEENEHYQMVYISNQSARLERF